MNKVDQERRFKSGIFDSSIGKNAGLTSLDDFKAIEKKTLWQWEEKMPEPVDFREFARALGTVIRFGPGDIVFRESDPPSFMYIILSGSVEIIVQDNIIETISESRALGILSLLDGQPRTITARVTEPTELALMDQKKFRYMVEEVPHFVWYVMTELAGRLRATNAAL